MTSLCSPTSNDEVAVHSSVSLRQMPGRESPGQLAGASPGPQSECTQPGHHHGSTNVRKHHPCRSNVQFQEWSCVSAGGTRRQLGVHFPQSRAVSREGKRGGPQPGCAGPQRLDASSLQATLHPQLPYVPVTAQAGTHQTDAETSGRNPLPHRALSGALPPGSDRPGLRGGEGLSRRPAFCPISCPHCPPSCCC